MYLSRSEIDALLDDLRRLDPEVAEKWRKVFTASAWIRRNHPDYPKGGPRPSLLQRIRWAFSAP